MIPTLPPSPPSSPERQLDVAPDWFRVTGKPTTDTLHGMITSLNSPNMTVPELSPPMSPETSSSDDGAHRPRRPRYSFQTHRRASEMAPEPAWTSAAPKHKHRARFASLPVAGMITPMWSIGEESDADDEEIRTPTSDRFQPDPFKMLLPFCKNDVKLPSYTLNEKDFVLAHVPTKRISAAAFRPRVPRVPRYQRPIVMTVLCVMLFGTLCMVSWFQQAAIDAQRATVIRQTVWLAKASAQIQGEEEARVDREPGFRPAAPAHHSLKVQSKLSPRLPQVELPPLEMSKAEELAALMHFVTGTAANALPITHDPTKQIEAEAFLPFNPASPDAMTELEELVREQWEQYPVMVLGKMRDPKMREIRRVLKTYNIKPAPAFVDFDQRSDSTLLDAVLARLLGKQNGPYVLMQGENLKASAVISLQKDEKVVELLSQAGATAAKRLKRNKHQKEEERWENERVLGPRTPDEAVVEPEDIVEEVVLLD